MKNKNIIRVDDIVKITIPNVFMRCGYPLTKKIVMETLYKQEHKDAVANMLKVFNINQSTIGVDQWLSENGVPTLYEEAMDNVLYALAKTTLKQQGWGGGERKIYTENRSEYSDKLAKVVGRRVVKTGTRYNANRSYDYYDGYYDYEPAGLKNEQSHVILKVCVWNCNSLLNEIEIEKCNVEKVTQDESYIPTTYLTTLYETK